MTKMLFAGPTIAMPRRFVANAFATGCNSSARIVAQILTRPLPFLVICGISLSALLVSAFPARAAEDAFLASRMTVSAPASAADLCTISSWACGRGDASAKISAGQLDLAVALNRKVNREVRQISDQTQYGRPDHWGLPTARGGDCEDFALLKKKLLVQAGVNPRRLLIATVLDRDRNAHAVLVLRTEEGDFVLDNLDDRILHWQSTGYTFLRMQNPDNPTRWTAVIAGGIINDDSAVATLRQIVALPSGRTAMVAVTR